MNKLSKNSTATVSATPSSTGLMLALEPRFMYDAAGLVTGIEGADAADSVDSINSSESNDGQTSHDEVLNLFNTFVPVEQRNTTELIFIDSAVKDKDTLLQNIASPNAEVITLDANRDGIEQISEVLSNYENLTSVHIISHGDVASVSIGNTQLSLETLDQYKAQLEGWSDSLTTEADILLYGCKVAGNDEGTAFVESIAALTDADIAASDDLTGSAKLGGDWVLETSTGNIESNIAFTDEGINDFDALLAPLTVTNNGLTVNQGDSAIISDANIDFIDPENGPLIYTLITAPVNGQLSIEFQDGTSLPISNGTSFNEADAQYITQTWNVVYTHNGLTTTPDSFTVMATDTEGYVAQTTLNINVIATANTSPVAVDDPTGNTGFENGFTNWETIGDVTIETSLFGVNPTEGTNQAFLSTGPDGGEGGTGSNIPTSTVETFLGLAPGSLDNLDNGILTDGAAIKQTITVNAGDTLSFDWNFLTTENTPDATYNDFAFVTLENLSELADTYSNFTTSTSTFGGGANETGYGTFTHTFTASGTYVLGIGVTDVGDYVAESGLLVDNIQLSSSTSTYTTDDNTVLTVNQENGVLANDYDGNGDILTVTGFDSTSAMGATVTVNANGSFTYDPTNSAILNAITAPTTDTFTYTISDGNGGFDTASVTILVNDVNDAPTITTTTMPDATEDQLYMYFVDATDPDGGMITFSLDTETAPTGMTIDPALGMINWTPANGDVGTHSITIRATDSSGLTTTQTLDLTVLETNDTPIAIDINNLSVDENVANGTVVGQLNTTDPDVGDTHTYSILNDTSGGAFGIGGTNTNELIVVNGSLLDFEASNSHQITIRTTDVGGLTFDQTFTITVNNVNENPTINNQTFNIDENLSAAAIVGTVVASDPDAGDALTYSITGGNTNNAFVIDASSGVITVNNSAALDFETNPIFALTIQVEDNGLLVDSGIITISLNDVNETTTVPPIVNVPPIVTTTNPTTSGSGSSTPLPQEPSNNEQNITLDNFNDPTTSTDTFGLEDTDNLGLTDPLLELDPTEVLEPPSAGEELIAEEQPDVFVDDQQTSEAANDAQFDGEVVAGLTTDTQSNPTLTEQIKKTSTLTAAERNEIIEILQKTSDLVNCR